MLKKPTGLQKAVVEWAVLLKEDRGGLADKVELSRSLICQSILGYFWNLALAAPSPDPVGSTTDTRDADGEQQEVRGNMVRLPVPLPLLLQGRAGHVLAVNEGTWWLPYITLPGLGAVPAVLSHRRLGVNAKMPAPSLWGYTQADAVAVCPLGASQCWRNPQRGGWTVLRADLHVSHSYHYFRANDLVLSIFENISCYRK